MQEESQTALSVNLKPQHTSLFTKLYCGAIAGVVGTSIIFPLDIIKTRLQNQKGNQYSGIIDCGRQLVRNNGIRGLYAGLAPNLVGIIPEKAIKLAVNDLAREYWAKQLSVHPDHLPIQYGMLAGATAGICQVIATNPMEIVKIQLQVSNNRKINTTELIKSMGIKGLYRGTTATLARDVPFSIIFFSFVSMFKDLGTEKGQTKPKFSTIFGSGVLAGAIAAAVVTPMDVVKTKLQVLPTDGVSLYSGQLDCYRSILVKDGISGLFKGVVPRVLIVSPLFAITVLIYEFQQRLFQSDSK
ncbi:mitochondrial carrier domain-containing protein [Globomyces pollinis-pini]|nr:mitochondrial carrier domain-containing protein [Globomyces pollinis-pini]